MEVPNVPKVTVTKSDDMAKVKVRDNGRTDLNSKATETTGTDSLNLSAKARTLAKLRSAYDKLPDSDTTIKQVQTKIAEQGHIHLSSEEIVAGILQGTLFQAI
jgi:hypothetical protein